MKNERPGLHCNVLDKHLPPKKLCAAMRATSLMTADLQPSPSVKNENPGLHCIVFDKILPSKKPCAAMRGPFHQSMLWIKAFRATSRSRPIRKNGPKQARLAFYSWLPRIQCTATDVMRLESKKGIEFASLRGLD